MTDRDRIRVFRGLHTATDPALLRAGESPCMINLESSTGKASVRPGLVHAPGLTPASLLGSQRRIMRVIPFVIPGEYEVGNTTVLVTHPADPSDPSDPSEDSAADPLATADVPGEDDGPSISFPGSEDTTEEPSGDWIITAILPALVYAGCEFTLALSAAGSGLFDGTGASLAVYSIRIGYWTPRDPILLTSADTAPDPIVGWSDNMWLNTVRVSDTDLCVYNRDALGVECLVGGERGYRDICELRYPDFVPTLPAGVIEAGVAFDAVVSCLDSAGAVLFSYANAGAGLTISFSKKVDGTWQSASVVQADGTAVAASAGWVDGVWTQSVKFAAGELDVATHVKMCVETACDTECAEKQLVAGCMLVFDAEIVDSATPWKTTITKYTVDGNVDPTYAGELSVLKWYGYAGGAWTELAGGSIPVLSPSGDPIDASAGWTDGVWTANVEMNDDLEYTYSQIKAFHVYDGVESCSDVALCGSIETLLTLSIKERQLAYGITTEWDSADPTNTAKLIDDTGTTTYTLDQFKAYVNHLTQGSIYVAPADNDWTGGATDIQTLNDATWADGATTVLELYSLIVTLKKTTVSTTYVDAEYYQGFSEEHATESGARSAAISDYSQQLDSLSRDCFATSGDPLYQTTFAADIRLGRMRVTWTVPDCDGVAHSDKIIAQSFSPPNYTQYAPSMNDVFGKQGQAIPDENGWGAIWTAQKASVNTSLDSGQILDNVRPEFSASYDTNLGFQLNNLYALVDWSFTHV